MSDRDLRRDFVKYAEWHGGSAGGKSDTRPADFLAPARSRAAAVVVLVAALATAGCAPGRATRSPGASLVAVEAELIRRHPPSVGGLTTIDDRWPEWTTFAWVTKQEQLCTATVRSDGNLPHVACAPAPEVLRTDGPPALSSKPVPEVVPVPRGSAERLFVGTVRGPADTVDVTLFGTAVRSRVVPLPTLDQRSIGAYAAWLPTVGQDGFDWSDIVTVTARDATGEVIAQIT